MRPKILVILGPTATGKSDLAVKLAKKFNCEIISADSRQVYKGLDIGTGKITKKEMRGIPHHLLDVVSPKKIFTVSEWKKLAEEKMENILSRGKFPIICGGTGFYIKAITDGVLFPEVPPNYKLRSELVKKSIEELVRILGKLDPRRLKTIDIKNPVRLIRAIEIAKGLGKVPVLKKHKSSYEIFQIGLRVDNSELKRRIHIRLISRIKKGMINEARKLHQNGLSFKRMRTLGLEYRYLADFIEKKITKKELIEKLYFADWHYAKRQITWFKRDKKIKWFDPNQFEKIEKYVVNFLAK